MEETNSLSVHQSIAYQTLVLTHKIVNTKKPTYLATNLCPQSEVGILLRSHEGNVIQPNYRLNSSRSGFLYRAAKLFNCLPKEVKLQEKLGSFNYDARKWVKVNITVKP